ncbi:MAG: hypothetical protein WCQ47_02845 [bacterium]
MKFLIVFFVSLISLSAFAQITEGVDHIGYYTDKVNNGEAFTSKDVHFLLDEIEPATGKTVLKTIFIPYVISLPDDVDRNNNIIILDRILEALEFSLSSETDNLLVSRVLEAETSLINHLNLYNSLNLETPEKSYYESGSLKNIVVRGRDGSIIGVNNFYENGFMPKSTSAITYDGDGNVYNVETEFYPNGKILRIANYKNGLPDGLVIKYNDAQSVISETLYVEGALDGKSTIFDKDRNVVYEVIYSNNKKIKITKFFPLLGKPESVFTYDKNTGKPLLKEQYKINTNNGQPYLSSSVNFPGAKSVDFNSKGKIIQTFTYTQPWSKGSASKNLEHFSALKPIDDKELELLLDRGLLSYLITIAKDYTDVSRISVIIEQLAFDKNIVMTTEQKGVVSGLEKEFNKLEHIIVETEIALDTSDAKSRIFKYIKDGNKSGAELVNLLFHHLYSDAVLNDGKLSGEALSLISNKGVIDYISHYSKSPELLAVVSILEKIFLVKPELGTDLKTNGNFGLKEYKSLIDVIAKFNEVHSLNRR